MFDEINITKITTKMKINLNCIIKFTTKITIN